MKQPSSQWTKEERLKLIFIISSHLLMTQPMGEELHDYVSRIKNLSGMPSEFLESNRGKLLEGFPYDDDDLGVEP